jgi:DNA-directed RNA polymerase subunit K/omega
MTSTKIEDFNDIMKNYDPNKNKTKNILSKYEKVKMIGIRAEQLQRGAEPNIKLDPNVPFNPREIAHEELHQRKLPMMICRKLPDGTKEYWRLDDMIFSGY